LGLKDLAEIRKDRGHNALPPGFSIPSSFALRLILRPTTFWIRVTARQSLQTAVALPPGTGGLSACFADEVHAINLYVLAFPFDLSIFKKCYEEASTCQSSGQAVM
jgi:hypothetical protein